VIPPGMNREAIEAAQRVVRGEQELAKTPPHVVARQRALSERVAEIRAELEAKAAEGDPKAKRLLRELYPDHELVRAEDAAVVLTHLQRTAEREPGEEG
jgi:hypothetical protein